MPPDRINNPMAALEMLSRSERWLFGALWYLQSGSECSKAVRNILWSMELLQADLEGEFRASCHRLLSDGVDR